MSVCRSGAPTTPAPISPAAVFPVIRSRPSHSARTDRWSKPPTASASRRTDGWKSPSAPIRAGERDSRLRSRAPRTGRWASADASFPELEANPMCSNEDGCGPEVARRAFLAGTAGLAGAGMAGRALGQPPAAASLPVPPTRVLDDPRAIHGPVTFTHNGQQGIGGYLARPSGEGAHPAVLVIAGNRISEEYIPNTCAALALAGYVGLAPDIFHILPDSAQ